MSLDESVSLHAILKCSLFLFNCWLFVGGGGSGSGSKFNYARVGSGQTISDTGRVRASVLSPCRPLVWAIHTYKPAASTLVSELFACPVSITEVAVELPVLTTVSTCDMAMEAVFEFSACSVTAKLKSHSLMVRESDSLPKSTSPIGNLKVASLRSGRNFRWGGVNNQCSLRPAIP